MNKVEHATENSTRVSDNSTKLILGAYRDAYGIPFKSFKDPEYIDAKIREIDDNFNLILIQERFDESMVLLKHLLCWKNSDLLHLKLNLVECGYHCCHCTCFVVIAALNFIDLTI